MRRVVAIAAAIPCGEEAEEELRKFKMNVKEDPSFWCSGTSPLPLADNSAIIRRLVQSECLAKGCNKVRNRIFCQIISDRVNDEADRIMKSGQRFRRGQKAKSLAITKILEAFSSQEHRKAFNKYLQLGEKLRTFNPDLAACFPNMSDRRLYVAVQSSVQF